MTPRGSMLGRSLARTLVLIDEHGKEHPAERDQLLATLFEDLRGRGAHLLATAQEAKP